jgi:hypothetical protein
MTVEELKRLVTEWHGIAQSAAIIYDSELREALAFIDELGEKTAAFDQPYRSAPQLREGYVRKGGTNPDRNRKFGRGLLTLRHCVQLSAKVDAGVPGGVA